MKTTQEKQKSNSIQQWKEILLSKTDEQIKHRLNDALADVKFLESIYLTGGENKHFSESFEDAAYRERNEVCKLTSACYMVLRERGITVNFN